MAEDSSPPRKKPRTSRRGKRISADRFYREALSEAERVMLPEAREMEGLGEEIAVLRVKLHQSLREHSDDLKLFLKGVELLVRAVSAQYRLSPKAQEQLMDSMMGVLEGVGESLGLSLERP